MRPTSTYPSGGGIRPSSSHRAVISSPTEYGATKRDPCNPFRIRDWACSCSSFRVAMTALLSARGLGRTKAPRTRGRRRVGRSVGPAQSQAVGGDVAVDVRAVVDPGRARVRLYVVHQRGGLLGGCEGVQLCSGALSEPCGLD